MPSHFLFVQHRDHALQLRMGFQRCQTVAGWFPATMDPYGPNALSISLSVDTGSVCKLVNENPVVNLQELQYFYTGICASPIDLFTFHITNPLSMLPLDGSYKVGVSTDSRFGILVDSATGTGVQLQYNDPSDYGNYLEKGDKVLFTFLDNPSDPSAAPAVPTI